MMGGGRLARRRQRCGATHSTRNRSRSAPPSSHAMPLLLPPPSATTDTELLLGLRAAAATSTTTTRTATLTTTGGYSTVSTKAKRRRTMSSCSPSPPLPTNDSSVYLVTATTASTTAPPPRRRRRSCCCTTTRTTATLPSAAIILSRATTANVRSSRTSSIVVAFVVKLRRLLLPRIRCFLVTMMILVVLSSLAASATAAPAAAATRSTTSSARRSSTGTSSGTASNAHSSYGLHATCSEAEYVTTELFGYVSFIDTTIRTPPSPPKTITTKTTTTTSSATTSSATTSTANNNNSNDENDANDANMNCHSPEVASAPSILSVGGHWYRYIGDGYVWTITAEPLDEGSRNDNNRPGTSSSSTTSTTATTTTTTNFDVTIFQGTDCLELQCIKYKSSSSSSSSATTTAPADSNRREGNGESGTVQITFFAEADETYYIRIRSTTSTTTTTTASEETIAASTQSTSPPPSMIYYSIQLQLANELNRCQYYAQYPTRYSSLYSYRASCRCNEHTLSLQCYDVCDICDTGRQVCGRITLDEINYRYSTDYMDGTSNRKAANAAAVETVSVLQKEDNTTTSDTKSPSSSLPPSSLPSPVMYDETGQQYVSTAAPVRQMCLSVDNATRVLCYAQYPSACTITVDSVLCSECYYCPNGVDGGGTMANDGTTTTTATMFLGAGVCADCSNVLGSGSGKGTDARNGSDLYNETTNAVTRNSTTPDGGFDDTVVAGAAVGDVSVNLRNGIFDSLLVRQLVFGATEEWYPTTMGQCSGGDLVDADATSSTKQDEAGSVTSSAYPPSLRLGSPASAKFLLLVAAGMFTFRSFY